MCYIKIKPIETTIIIIMDKYKNIINWIAVTDCIKIVFCAVLRLIYDFNHLKFVCQ